MLLIIDRATSLLTKELVHMLKDASKSSPQVLLMLERDFIGSPSGLVGIQASGGSPGDEGIAAREPFSTCNDLHN